MKKEYKLEETEPNKTNITNIILNTVKYHPRKTSTEESKITSSKFDNFDPIFKPDGKRSSKVKYNKYDGTGRKKAYSFNQKFIPLNKITNKNFENVNNGNMY